MKTSSGALILINRFKNRSLGSTSMSRLWIRISHLSKVCVPWPHGDFLVGICSFFVGRGMGPLSLTPVLSAMSRISVHIVLMSWGLVLESRILAFETIPGHLDFHFSSGEGNGWVVVLKRVSVGVTLTVA